MSTQPDPLTTGLNAAPPSLRYADIGINLSDPVYAGIYHGKRAHDPDLTHVVSRALAAGVRKMMITGSDLHESRKAVELAAQFPGLCFATVGIHPCSGKTLDGHPGGAEKCLAELKELAAEGKGEGVTAFGEIGLDYDRLQLCDRETQVAVFAAQLDLATELDLPLFLHSRAAAEDFEGMLRERLGKLPRRGIVHSFTGTVEEMRRVVGMGFDVGVNGCSMKTEENLEVVRAIPLEHLQIETDGPWCEMRPSHASAKHLEGAPVLPRAVKKERWTEGTMVKGRNEPCTISSVAHAIAKVKGVAVEEVCEQ